ncbi:hypothetical protein ABH966_004988, partial [Lysinibacillus sp. RC46]
MNRFISGAVCQFGCCIRRGGCSFRRLAGLSVALAIHSVTLTVLSVTSASIRRFVCCFR